MNDAKTPVRATTPALVALGVVATVFLAMGCGIDADSKSGKPRVDATSAKSDVAGIGTRVKLKDPWFGWRSKADFDLWMKSHLADDEIGRKKAYETAVALKPGTQVLLIEHETFGSGVQVRIEDGPYQGLSLWTVRDAIERSR